MPDLFTPTETTNNFPIDNKNNPSASLVSLKKGDSRSKSLFKVYYKGKDGKFSDKESARIVQIERDNRIFKNNWYYWKRQAERLSSDYYTEHEKVIVLEEKVKILQEKLNSLTYYVEKTSIQQQKVSPS